MAQNEDIYQTLDPNKNPVNAMIAQGGAVQNLIKGGQDIKINSLAIQKEKQDLSENAQINQILKKSDPNNPDATFKALNAVAPQKAIAWKKQMNDLDIQTLTKESTKTETEAKHAKMVQDADAATLTKLDNQSEYMGTHADEVIKAYGDGKDPAAVLKANQIKQNHVTDMTDQGIYGAAAQAAARKDPEWETHFDKLSKEDQKALAPAYKAYTKPVDIQKYEQLKEDSKTLNDRAKNEMEKRTKEANIKEAEARSESLRKDKTQVVPFQTIDPVTKTPITNYAVIDKQSGKVIDTGAKVAPKAGAAGDAPQEEIDRFAHKLVDGTLDPKLLPIRGTTRDRALSRAIELDPSYDTKKYPIMEKALKDFTGPTGDGKNVTAIQTAYNHLGLLGPLAQNLNNKDLQILNKYKQAYAEQTGKAAPTNFDAVKGVALDEVSKAVIGGTGGGQGDREKYEDMIKKSQSPEQLSEALANITGLMQGRVGPLLDKARAANLTEGQIKKIFKNLYKTPEETEAIENSGASDPYAAFKRK